MPAILVRKRVVPSRPCSFENFALKASWLRTGVASSIPKSDQVPELKKRGLERDGTPAKAESAMMSYAEFSALVDLPRFQALDETYG